MEVLILPQITVTILGGRRDTINIFSYLHLEVSPNFFNKGSRKILIPRFLTFKQNSLFVESSLQASDSLTPFHTTIKQCSFLSIDFHLSLVFYSFRNNFPSKTIYVT